MQILELTKKKNLIADQLNNDGLVMILWVKLISLLYFVYLQREE